ncbi:MAG: alpha/beta hydrolase [Gemmataceae bacterium]
MRRRKTRRDDARGSMGESRVLAHDGFESKLLGNRRRLTVHLPPGYADDRDRFYPVLYLHDGQNLFDPARATFGKTWRAGETADRLARAGRIRPVILVGIDNTADRLSEYGWWPESEHRTEGRGEAYARFVMEEVKPFIDRTYRTEPGRADTAVAGASMGGLIALTMAWKFTAQVGLCGVLSPSLWWARCRVLDELEDDHGWMKRVRLWMCIGSREGRRLRGHLTPHINHCRRLVETLDAAGLVPGRNYLYTEVAGGQHDEDAWARRFDKVLLYLFGW